MANDNQKSQESTMLYRLNDKVRFSRIENGVLVRYQAGTAKDTVSLTAREASKFAPGRITAVTGDSTAEEVKEVIEKSNSPVEVKAIRNAELTSDHPRKTVVRAADERLTSLGVDTPVSSTKKD